MFRKMMLAGLMTATVLGGIAPAYAQMDPAQRGERSDRGDRGWRGERPGRPDGGPAMGRDPRMERPRGPAQAQAPAQAPMQAPAQRWQQPTPVPPAGGMAPPRPDPRFREPNLPQNRAIENQVRERHAQQQNWRNARRDDRQDRRQDWRNDRREERQDWRNERRDDRRDWRDDRRDDRRWTDNRGWNGTNWNNGRRYDDRTRWSTQRRWDNGWRQDRRYDWSSYRNRYGDRYRMGRYYAPRGWDYGYRRFSVGIMLNSMLYSNNYWLDDPYAYRLPPAYGTLRWVRYYDDALLVDVRDGYVVDVIHDFFW
ncbi:RcnB family protein [Sphingobium sp. HBC34]|uniref:RcnB family protein n=1 Tax=Sphingobium cyanobacteriorum TaxID=3063954 RepID=A0ABT8ZQW4_9SPHN|nr:RcnB family protein [Sphingobium sp. HBC34]MDO7836938.1 RcnB family protein [Sphingobium sp. HBC34]